MAQKKNKINFFVKNKKVIILSATVLILVTILGIGAYSKMQKNKIERALATDHVQSLVDKTSLGHQIATDIVLGDANAPVTMIEYASLSCPHCASFYNNVFKQIKENYIDTKKVKFIYRDFPLNQSALLAAVVSTCYAKTNPDKYYNFIKVLFKTQESWAFANDFEEKLSKLSKLDGMTAKEFTACSTNQDLINEMLQNRMKAAQELGIDSTPTFIIDGEVIGGYRDFEGFKKVLDEKLK